MEAKISEPCQTEDERNRILNDFHKQGLSRVDLVTIKVYTGESYFNLSRMIISRQLSTLGVRG